jgi:large subunit ribosomal protein L30
MNKKIQLTLVKSLIGRKPKHVVIAKQLGLGKTNSTVMHNDTPAIRGLVNAISYLLLVEEAV